MYCHFFRLDSWTVNTFLSLIKARVSTKINFLWFIIYFLKSSHNTRLAQNYNPHCNIILILILGAPTVTTITISRPATNPTTDPNGNGPAISSMSQNEPNLINIGENSIQTSSTLSRPGSNRSKLPLSHQLVLQAPGTKVRRDYRMAPKVTIS